MISSSSRDRLVAALPLRQPVVAAAGVVWMGCALGLARTPASGRLVVVVLVLLASVAAARLGRPTAGAALAGLVLAGMASGMLAAGRIEAAAAVPVRRTPTAGGTCAVDPAAGSHGSVMLVRASGPSTAGEVTLLASLDDLEGKGPVGDTIAAGDLVTIDGTVADRPGHYRGTAYRAAIDVDSVELVAAASGPFFGPGNLLRRVVLHRLEQNDSDAAALVAGFLVGETDRLPDHRMDELRRAGLTHFVAVSGSNVALFLAAWWLIIGPFGLDPRLRALLGVVALGAFVVATRWEPSVVRAAAMAGVVLGGRVVGVPVEPWRALGLAVAGLLLVSGDLAVDVGFQLSVAATAGVLAAIELVPRRRPRWLWTALTVTVGAQVAVLPIILVHFDTVPLLSPVANLLAAPLVTAATVLGGIGAITGIGPVLDLALMAAGGVLTVASTAAGWPQLGPGGVVITGLAAVGFAFAGPLRPFLGVAACAGLVAWGVPASPPSEPAVVFLDVGQGDAILIRRPPDVVILVDGGRDVAVLEGALRRHGVGEIDVLAVTHGDADHAGGLQGVVERHRVGEIWYPEGQDHGELIESLLVEAAAGGVPVAAVGAGDVVDFGSLRLELLAPRRRYAAENDGSIVTLVTAGGIDVLLTGDVEAVAQAELPPVRPDVLQVPHHGSATTDLNWLAETVGSVAVISVGENTYGHPTPGVLDVLASAGSTVLTTLGEGDVIVPLCPCPSPP